MRKIDLNGNENKANLNFAIGSRIRHYKGAIYVIFAIGTHSTGEEVYIYRNIKDHKIMTRPVKEFYDIVQYKGEWVNLFEVVEI